MVGSGDEPYKSRFAVKVLTNFTPILIEFMLGPSIGPNLTNRYLALGIFSLKFSLARSFPILSLFSNPPLVSSDIYPFMDILHKPSA